MKENQLNTRDLMEEMLVREIRRLVNAADHVDPELPESDREVPVSFAFQGIGIWFMCRRYGETFHMRHVIVEIDGDGRFLRGQVGEQEGYWEDFPSYLSDERLLSNIIQAKAA